MVNISKYIRNNPARMSGYISALILWAHKYFSAKLVDFLIPSILFMVALGEYSQRVEDKKTIKAIYLEPDPNRPDEELIKEI
jgi:hypothetical protein